jgi:Xaa-Pro aminopeptidase
MTLARKAQNVKMIPLSRKFFDGLRLLKSPEDKKKIEKAAEIASRSCEEVLGSGLLGRTEMDVAAELEHRFRQNGAHGIAFDTIVASGVRSALPHGKATEKVIQSGELVVIDFGCRFDGYHSDETVTCSVGPASPEQQKVHQAVYQAHMKAIDSIKVGARLCVLDRVAREIIGRAGYGKYFVHRLGHGVGLEVHEPPYLSSQASGVVAEGMVFTIEPGVYLERVGGVRLESLIFVDSAGPAILSSMSKNLITVHPHR